MWSLSLYLDSPGGGDGESFIDLILIDIIDADLKISMDFEGR